MHYPQAPTRLQGMTVMNEQADQVDTTALLQLHRFVEEKVLLASEKRYIRDVTMCFEELYTSLKQLPYEELCMRIEKPKTSPLPGLEEYTRELQGRELPSWMVMRLLHDTSISIKEVLPHELGQQVFENKLVPAAKYLMVSARIIRDWFDHWVEKEKEPPKVEIPFMEGYFDPNTYDAKQQLEKRLSFTEFCTSRGLPHDYETISQHPAWATFKEGIQ